MWIQRISHHSVRVHWFVSFLLAGLAAAGIVSSPPSIKDSVKAVASADTYSSRLPLYFIENRGQLDSRIAYYLQGYDKTIYFSSTGLTYALSSQEDSERWILKLDFVGANRLVRPRGEKQTQASFSYFSGPRENWNTGLRTYNRIVYPDLWPGIDLTYEGTLNRMKYTFVVRPGADPNRTRLAYRGADRVAINPRGALEVSTRLATFQDEKPVSFQRPNGGGENERGREKSQVHTG